MTSLKTTFSDGDVFYSGITSDTDKLNGITTEINRKGVIHRKIYSSAEEVNNDSGDYTDTEKVFSFSAPVNSIILSLTLQAEIKSSAASRALADLKVTGTNIGTKYIINRHAIFDTNHSDDFYLSPSLEDSEFDTASCFISGYNTSYKVVKNTMTEPIKILDDTTTFTIRINGSTAYLRNAFLTICYIENYTED